MNQNANSLYSLNTEKAALFLRLSLTQVYRLIKEGEIPHRIENGKARFSPSELETWVLQKVIY